MPERLKVWQILFLLFPILIWLSWTSYTDFKHLEEEGGILYVSSLDKLLYDIAGKWAVIGFPILIAGVWGYAIWKTLALSKRADLLRAQAEEGLEINEPAPVSKPPRAVSKPPISKPPVARAPSISGPIKPLAASAPPAPVRADDRPPDPSGPKLLR